MRVLLFTLFTFFAIQLQAQVAVEKKGQKKEQAEEPEKQDAKTKKGKKEKEQVETSEKGKKGKKKDKAEQPELSKEEKEKAKKRAELEKDLKKFEAEYKKNQPDTLDKKARKQQERAAKEAAEEAKKKPEKQSKKSKKVLPGTEEEIVSTPVPKELAITYFDTDKNSRPIPAKAKKPQVKRPEKKPVKSTLKKDQLTEFSYYAQRIAPEPDTAKFSIKIPYAKAGTLDKVRFEKAMELVKYKFYDKALPLLKAILASVPSNPNINYWLGIAYLKGYGDYTKALPYLITASQKTNYEYNFKDLYKNVKAPVDAIYYAGLAYHLNGQLSEAERDMQLFISVVDRKNDKEKMLEKAELRLKQIRAAQAMQRKPLPNIKIENLGEELNSYYADFAAKPTGEGNQLYFSSARPKADGSDKNVINYDDARFFYDIYAAQADELRHFGAATSESINTETDELLNGITADGKLMYLFKEDEKYQDYFISLNSLGAWQEAEALFQLKNTLKWGRNYAVNANRDRIIFASNSLPGSLGGYDLYMITRLLTGDWSEPVNLGNKVNTPYDEDYPSFHPNGNVIYYSSNNEKSIGGFDIFRSRFRANEDLDKAENLGQPINTYNDDLYYTLDYQGKNAYYSKHAVGGMGDLDIYRITYDTNKTAAPNLPPFNNTIVKVELVNNLNADQVSIKNLLTEETTTYKADTRSRLFKVLLQPCVKYNITYTNKASVLRNENFVVPCDLATPGKTIAFGTEEELKVGSLAQSSAAELEEVRPSEKERFEWQLTYNGKPYEYPNIELHYLNSKGYISQIVKTDARGTFTYFEIPFKENFVFELQVPELNMCDKFKVELMKVGIKGSVPVAGYSFGIRCYLR